MKYITGIFALNLNCKLNTCGDWHQTSVNWKNVPLKESENSFFGEYGLEFNKKIPEHLEFFVVANHIRACLDMLVDKQFDLLKGMNKDFICNDDYNEEIFPMVLRLNVLPYWNEIKMFMDKEYGNQWIDYRKKIMNMSTCDYFKHNKSFINYHKYKKVIHNFLLFLNLKSNSFVLKGSIALIECYNLNRLSMNINFDSKKDGKIFLIVKEFCKINNYSFNILKDEPLVNRIMIDYGDENNSIVVDVSLRTGFKESNVIIINGIKTYNINKLTELKIDVFNCRSNIVDAFDIAHIYNHYKKELLESTILKLVDNVLFKGIEFVEYLIENQNDEFIDKDNLKQSYLKMYYDIENEALKKCD